jgi:hypothetical protein
VSWRLLPPFVNAPTALSMLFVGRSLNYIQARGLGAPTTTDLRRIPAQLASFAQLDLPVGVAELSRAVSGIRRDLSRTTLQRILPTSQVLAVLQLLRDFMSLGRGNFATALVRQAQDHTSNRWRQEEDPTQGKRGQVGTTIIRDGEVAAVLSRTWASLSSAEAQHIEEDAGLELARATLRLVRAPGTDVAPSGRPHTEAPVSAGIVKTPFNNLLLGAPISLTANISPPFDLVLAPSDMEAYTAVNAYLLSIRRAHIGLTDLWTASSLRRHHPSPPAPGHRRGKRGAERIRALRGRSDGRNGSLRTIWATSSAVLFLLSELESYLQIEVASVLWDGLQAWMRNTRASPQNARPGMAKTADPEEDLWLLPETAARPAHQLAAPGQAADPDPSTDNARDPEALATAHRCYLRSLVDYLLLAEEAYAAVVYGLLLQIEQLVGLVNRLQSIWASMDLEADVGIVDALVDLDQEEVDVRNELRSAETRVREGARAVVGSLREVEAARSLQPRDDKSAAHQDVGEGTQGPLQSGEQDSYRPARIGGLDRLLMKLEFGTWFDR